MDIMPALPCLSALGEYVGKALGWESRVPLRLHEGGVDMRRIVDMLTGAGEDVVHLDVHHLKTVLLLLLLWSMVVLSGPSVRLSTVLHWPGHEARQ